MYQYIKGHKTLMEEHMLSATELAKMFGLYTLNNNPNGLLVSCVLANYIKNNNLNVSEYYYPHSRGVMRVYPSIIYQKALNDFVFDLVEETEYTYIDKDNKRKIGYKYKQRKNGTVISITERSRTNGRK